MINQTNNSLKYSVQTQRCYVTREEIDSFTVTVMKQLH